MTKFQKKFIFGEITQNLIKNIFTSPPYDQYWLLKSQKTEKKAKCLVECPFKIIGFKCWLNYPHVALVKIQFLVTKTLQKLIGPSTWLSACIWGLKNVHLHLIHRSYTGILIKMILTISFESWILVIFHILAKIYIFTVAWPVTFRWFPCSGPQIHI